MGSGNGTRTVGWSGSPLSGRGTIGRWVGMNGSKSSLFRVAILWAAAERDHQTIAESDRETGVGHVDGTSFPVAQILNFTSLIVTIAPMPERETARTAPSLPCPREDCTG